MFLIPGELTTSLLTGDNILAAEVHNYNALSADVTFGTSLDAILLQKSGPELKIQNLQDALTLSWDRGGFTLQQSDSVAGPWNDVAGPIVSSPFTTTNSIGTQFYRLRR